MLTRYDDVIAQKYFLLITRFVMELTQNNVLIVIVDRKLWSANRLVPLSSDYSERFRRQRQICWVLTL